MSGTPLPVSLVRVGIEAESREDLFRRLVRDLVAAGALREEDEPYRRLVEREAVHSTAVGGGVALPHARTRSAPDVRCAVARLKRGVYFKAPDGRPVDLVFLLVGPPESPIPHVHLLGRIARLLEDREVVRALREAPDEASLSNVLARESVRF
jgi:mannitol/fructose-specific phosphotransferase system IIA component (Ntr-type)